MYKITYRAEKARNQRLPYIYNIAFTGTAGRRCHAGIYHLQNRIIRLRSPRPPTDRPTQGPAARLAIGQAATRPRPGHHTGLLPTSRVYHLPHRHQTLYAHRAVRPTLVASPQRSALTILSAALPRPFNDIRQGSSITRVQRHR